MKKGLLYITIAAALALTAGCSEADYLPYQDTERVHFVEPDAAGNIDSKASDVTVNFCWDPGTVTERMIDIPVYTTGRLSPHPRTVKITQAPEYRMDIVYDEKGNAVDTVYTEYTNKAIPGKHYKALEEYYTMEANSNKLVVPITVMRDATLAAGSVRLHLKLVGTEDFQTAPASMSGRTIAILDELGMPSNWSSATWWFGSYSVRKHRFMIDATGGAQIDEEWLRPIQNSDLALATYYKAFFKAKLDEYNNDPANIAAGLAPMKDEDKNLVTFPN